MKNRGAGTASRYRIKRLFLLFALCFTMGCPSDPPRVPMPPPPESPSQTEPFIEVSSGLGNAQDGTRLPFRVYETPDGTRADISFGTFPSPALAKAQLHAWLKLPHRIENNEAKVDAQGKVIGERIVGSFKGADGKEVTKVIWTEGTDYYEIGSLSKSTALQLEKWVHPPHPPLL